MKRLAITMGDPLGIGPEVVVKAVSAWNRPGTQLVVIGSVARLGSVKSQLELPLAWHELNDVSDLKNAPLEGVLVVAGPDVDLPWGVVAKEAGMAAYRYIEMATQAALSGDVSGIVTAPIHKEAIHLAGVPDAGHTEILARLCDVKEVAMMLVGGGLRVSHATTHLSLQDAIASLDPAKIRKAVMLTAQLLERVGAQEKPIAVAGLNPHNGEHGLFGDVEEVMIRPTVTLLQQEGYKVEGPIPADTVFARAKQGHFAAVVALYHDQGHIPVKLLAFDEAVNLTLGLPIIRTSVDHGTGFDIAGRGIASPKSMTAAIEVADQLS